MGGPCGGSCGSSVPRPRDQECTSACEKWLSPRAGRRPPPVSPKAVNASEEFLGQRDDDARRASHVAESVLILVLGHLADEFGAVGAQASDGVVDAFDCKHDAPEAQCVRRCDRRFDLDQFWIAKLRQLKPPLPIWGPHHNDVDFDALETFHKSGSRTSRRP